MVEPRTHFAHRFTISARRTPLPLPLHTTIPTALYTHQRGMAGECHTALEAVRRRSRERPTAFCLRAHLKCLPATRRHHRSHLNRASR